MTPKGLYFLWGPKKMNVKIHKNCENTGKILKILCERCHFVKFVIYFLGFSREIFFVSLQITNYIYSPWKMQTKNAILFKLFWSKNFVLWKLK